MFVILILLAAGASISFTVYFLERTTEEDEFEAAFVGTADKIIDSLQQVTKTISAMAGLAVTATGEAQQQFGNVTAPETKIFSGWPFFTMDAFQARAQNVKILTRSFHINMGPIVGRHQLKLWEEYVRSDANSWM